MEPGKILKVKLKRLAGGTSSKVGKKRITVKDGAGKSYVFKISGRRTKVKIAGKKAKSKAQLSKGATAALAAAKSHSHGRQHGGSVATSTGQCS